MKLCVTGTKDPQGYFEPGQCGECYKGAEKTVRVGDEPAWDSATVYLCESCLQKALELIRGSSGGPEGPKPA